MLRSQSARIIVVGDATLDLISVFDRWPSRGKASLADKLQYAPGGTAFNVALGLARLQVPVIFIGRFSNDLFGNFLREVASLENVTLGITAPSTLPTRIVLTKIDRHGSASFMAFNRPAADDDLGLDYIDQGLISEASFLFTTGLTLRFEPSRICVSQLMKLAKKGGVPIAFDPNVRSSKTKIDLTYRTRLQWASRLADIYLPNLSEELRIRELDIRSLRKRILKQSNSSTMVIKRGARGCQLASNGILKQFASPRVDVIDATGAGDAFNVGFLFALYHGNSLENACRIGNIVGAINTTVPGASNGMPTLDKLEPFL